MIRVNKDEFLRKLEAIEPGLAQKAIQEQSTCFVFKDGKIIAYNDEVACSIDSGLKDFNGAVQAEPLLSLLRKLSEDTIRLSLGQNELLVRGNHRRSGISFEPDISLPIQDVEIPGKWIPLHEDFCEAIGMVGQCVSKDENLFKLTCIHIHPKWIEASDDYQICRWRLPTGLDHSILAKGEYIKSITKLGMTHLSETENWLHFKNALGLVYSCRKWSGEDYPKTGRIMKFEGVSTALPKGLVEATEKADIFSSENDDNQVTVKLMPDKLLIRGQGARGWYEEEKAMTFHGKPMEFLIPPNLLSDIVKKYNECIVGNDKLKVEGGSYIYLTCLSQPTEFNQEEVSAKEEVE